MCVSNAQGKTLSILSGINPRFYTKLVCIGSILQFKDISKLIITQIPAYFDENFCPTKNMLKANRTSN